MSAQNRVAPVDPRYDPKSADHAVEERILGARFVVRLPAM
jgi:hypothetical protein